MARVPVGGGGGGVYIPGDPGALRQAASTYSKVGSAMGNVAAQLVSSLGSVSNWVGAGATAHAGRVQALATAHRVAAEALLSGAQALTTYAQELEDAQALAEKANNAMVTAADTAIQLQSVESAEATASTKPQDPAFAARFGDFSIGESPAQQDAQKAAQLQSTLDAQNQHASSLATQATNMAHTAGLKAAAAFRGIAALAGNASDRGSGNPLLSYLGAPSTASATHIITQAQIDLIGGSKNAKAAAAALKQGPPTAAQQKQINELKSKIWQPLPAGFSAWPAALQLSWLNSINKNEQQLEDSEWEIMLAMGYGSVGAGDAGDDGDGGDGGDDGGSSGVDDGEGDDAFTSAINAMIGGTDDIPPGFNNDTEVPLAPNGGLGANEGPAGVGGHTLTEHVDVDLAYLNQRLDNNPKMKTASVYTNRATAEAATDGAVAANRTKIDNWLAGSGKKLVLDKWEAPDQVGIGVVQKGRGVVGLRDVQVIIMRSSAYPSGYYILTSYPAEP